MRTSNRLRATIGRPIVLSLALLVIAGPVRAGDVLITLNPNGSHVFEVNTGNGTYPTDDHQILIWERKDGRLNVIPLKGTTITVAGTSVVESNSYFVIEKPFGDIIARLAGGAGTNEIEFRDVKHNGWLKVEPHSYGGANAKFNGCSVHGIDAEAPVATVFGCIVNKVNVDSVILSAGYNTVVDEASANALYAEVYKCDFRADFELTAHGFHSPTHTIFETSTVERDLKLMMPPLDGGEVFVLSSSVGDTTEVFGSRDRDDVTVDKLAGRHLVVKTSDSSDLVTLADTKIDVTPLLDGGAGKADVLKANALDNNWLFGLANTEGFEKIE